MTSETNVYYNIQYIQYIQYIKYTQCILYIQYIQYIRMYLTLKLSVNG